MESLISGFGVMRALVPVLYWGGLAFYFFGVGGSVENLRAIGLWPYVVGLSIMCLLFCIPLTIRLMRLFRRPRPPGGPYEPDHDGFDPDAAIARYMASRSVEPTPSVPASRPAYTGRGPAKPCGFGRRTR